MRPSLEPDGEVVYRDRDVELALERYHDTDVADDMVTHLRQPATRPTGVAREHHLYFSVACGGCGDGRLYYLNDGGEAVLYYTVALEHMTVPSCEGPDGNWSGNIAFGDDGHLYLTSGRQRVERWTRDAARFNESRTKVTLSLSE